MRTARVTAENEDSPSSKIQPLIAARLWGQKIHRPKDFLAPTRVPRLPAGEKKKQGCLQGGRRPERGLTRRVTNVKKKKKKEASARPTPGGCRAHWNSCNQAIEKNDQLRPGQISKPGKSTATSERGREMGKDRPRSCRASPDSGTLQGHFYTQGVRRLSRNRPLKVGPSLTGPPPLQTPDSPITTKRNSGDKSLRHGSNSFLQYSHPRLGGGSDPKKS